MVEESNAGTKKKRHEVNVDFVEEAGIQQLLDGVSTVDPDGLPGGRGSGLFDGAVDAVRHEMDRRLRSAFASSKSRKVA